MNYKESLSFLTERETKGLEKLLLRLKALKEDGRLMKLIKIAHNFVNHETLFGTLGKLQNIF